MKTTKLVHGFMLAAAIYGLAACSSSQTSSSTADATTATPDEVAQQTAIDKTAKASLAKNFYFVFDGSGSMRDAPKHASSDGQGFHSKIEGAKWAVREFLKTVPNNVNLGLYVFDAAGDRQVLALNGNNRPQFLNAVNNIRAGGGTPLGAAIATACQDLAKEQRKQLGYGEYKLIVITDGEANDSITHGTLAADKYKIPIYTIGFDMGETHSLRKHSISYRSADSAAQVEKALEQASAELEVYDPADYKHAQAAHTAAH